LTVKKELREARNGSRYVGTNLFHLILLFVVTCEELPPRVFLEDRVDLVFFPDFGKFSDAALLLRLRCGILIQLQLFLAVLL